MSIWSQQNKEVPNDDLYSSDLVVEDSYTPDLDLTGAGNQVTLSGVSASPNVQAQSFKTLDSEINRKLYSLTYKLTRQGTPSGYLQAGLYTHDGSYGSGTSGLFLGKSVAIDADDISTNGIYEEVEFLFDVDLILSPLTAYYGVLRFIGTAFAPNYIRVAIDQAGSTHLGSKGQAFVGSSEYFDEVWPDGILFSIDVNRDLWFKAKSISPVVGDSSYLPQTTWTKKPSLGSTTWARKPTLPDTDWDRYAAFDDWVQREELGLLDRAEVEIVERDVEITAREFLGISEVYLGRFGGSLAEELSLLDRAEVETVDRAQSFELAEELGLLDRAEVDIGNRNVSILAREYMGISEDVVYKPTIFLEEALSLLDRAEVEVQDRNVDITAREFLGISEEVLADVEYGAKESLGLLDRAEVETVDRAISIEAREFLGIAELIDDIPDVPRIESGQIAAGDIDESNDAVRCRFTSNGLVNSVRIQRSVDGGAYTLHQNLDITPEVLTFSNYYFGSETEFVTFRIIPFSGSGQTGTQGANFDTNLVQIPSSGGEV